MVYAHSDQAFDRMHSVFSPMRFGCHKIWTKIHWIGLRDTYMFDRLEKNIAGSSKFTIHFPKMSVEYLAYEI